MPRGQSTVEVMREFGKSMAASKAAVPRTGLTKSQAKFQKQYYAGKRTKLAGELRFYRTQAKSGPAKSQGAVEPSRSASKALLDVYKKERGIGQSKAAAKAGGGRVLPARGANEGLGDYLSRAGVGHHGQPRHPAGTSRGGQWKGSGRGGRR